MTATIAKPAVGGSDDVIDVNDEPTPVSGAAGLGGPSTAPGLDRVIVFGFDVVRRHSLIIGVLATVFLFVKVIRVSRTDPGTAMTLISSADASTITLGGALSLLYTLTSIGIVTSLCVVGRRHEDVTGHLVASMGAAALSLGAGLLLLPVPVVAALAILAFGWRALDALGRRLPYPTPEIGLGTSIGRLGLVVLTAASLAMTLWILIDERPWVAVEHLDTTAGPIVGYVVSSGDWVTVLTEDRRTIRRLRDGDIKARDLCDLKRGSALRTLPQILSADDSAGRYRACR